MDQGFEELAKDESLAVIGGVGRMTQVHGVAEKYAEGLRHLGRLGWQIAPEVSFAIMGERGVIDLLAWHAPTRTLLVIELKTEIVDIGELVGVVDRKTRLAERIGRERGWYPLTVATWVVVGEGPTNRRRVAAHAAILRAAFPTDGRSMRKWLAAPSGRVAALSFFSDDRPSNVKPGFASQKRVRGPRASAAERKTGGNGGGSTH